MNRSPWGGCGRSLRSTRSGTPRRNLVGTALVAGALVAAPLALTGGATGASAATPHATVVTDCPTWSTNFGGNTDPSKVVQVRFSYRPGTQSWVVPSNAVPNSICIDASGAQGGSTAGGTGGTGGDVNIVPTVTANQVLTVVVGKQGSGGGPGGTGGATGGGASAVFAPGGAVIAVAGSGGGAGATANGGAGGPHAGSSSAPQGLSGSDGTLVGSGGGGATASGRVGRLRAGVGRVRSHHVGHVDRGRER